MCGQNVLQSSDPTQNGLTRNSPSKKIEKHVKASPIASRISPKMHVISVTGCHRPDRGEHNAFQGISVLSENWLWNEKCFEYLRGLSQMIFWGRKDLIHWKFWKILYEGLYTHKSWAVPNTGIEISLGGFWFYKIWETLSETLATNWGTRLNPSLKSGVNTTQCAWHWQLILLKQVFPLPLREQSLNACDFAGHICACVLTRSAVIGIDDSSVREPGDRHIYSPWLSYQSLNSPNLRTDS